VKKRKVCFWLVPKYFGTKGKTFLFLANFGFNFALKWRTYPNWWRFLKKVRTEFERKYKE